MGNLAGPLRGRPAGPGSEQLFFPWVLRSSDHICLPKNSPPAPRYGFAKSGTSGQNRPIWDPENPKFSKNFFAKTNLPQINCPMLKLHLKPQMTPKHNKFFQIWATFNPFWPIIDLNFDTFDPHFSNICKVSGNDK